jgi:calcineurin-like phosphoesterase family protein
MSNVWFCSDLHFGHRNIHNLRKGLESEQDNVDRISDWWFRLVKDRDLVWVLGDAAFTEEAIDRIALLPGKKNLVRGNHDHLPTASYLRAFSEIYGIIAKYGYWLSHAPIHPDELRGKVNVHGHVHYATITTDEGYTDWRYFNACVENANFQFGCPLFSLEELRGHLAARPKLGGVRLESSY